MSIVHGGNLEKLAAEAHCAPDEILDFSVNLNPCGQPEGLFQVWFRAFDHAAPYPEPYAESVCRMIAGKLSCPADCVLAGNGSGELLDLLPRAFDSRRAVIVTPGYLEYEEAKQAEYRAREVERSRDTYTENAKKRCKSVERLRKAGLL